MSAKALQSFSGQRQLKNEKPTVFSLIITTFATDLVNSDYYTYRLDGHRVSQQGFGHSRMMQEHAAETA